MKQLLFVTTSFPDEAFQKGQEAAGGFVADFAQALGQHVPVTVVAPSGRNSIEQNGRLTIRRFAVPSLPLSLLKPQNPTHWLKIRQTLRAGQQAVTEAAQETAVDYIFALWALPSGYWAYRVSQKQNIPYSIWALGSDIWTLGRLPVVKNILKTVLQHAHHRFADGYLLADDVKAISGLDCQFLPSSRKLTPVEEKTLSTSPPYRLAFLGRWHPNKGIDLLLDSLTHLHDEDWKRIAAVQICGGGPLEEVVKTAVANLQAAGYPVTLRGYLNQDEARELLIWADYLLLPSRIESIPVIFSDAMQVGCPLISTPVGDLPRLLKTYQIGELAEMVTAVAYMQAIQKALRKGPQKYTTELPHVRNQFNVATSVKRLLNCLNKAHSDYDTDKT